MNNRGKNKENQLPAKNMKITDCFRVKKCLFDLSQPEFASPTNELVLGQDSSDADSPNDSPYALFNIRKKRSLKTDCFKSLNRSNKSTDETPNKRSHVFKQLSHSIDVSMESPIRSCSSNLAEIIEKDMSDITLRGDFSQPCILPVINGKHPDLKSISIHTVNHLLNDELLNFTIIDCRYPYEFEGGHIKSLDKSAGAGIRARDLRKFSPTLCLLGYRDL
ncbi:hypothetical protein TNCV_369411 [Trichonephila clavipes]|nr:hypothetical protein TNCV_369411 [Trichonephila clavipes]